MRPDPLSNAFTSTVTTTGAPNTRRQSVTLWTGKKVIIWAGHAWPNSNVNDGALYDPTADTWTTMSAVGAPSGRSNQHNSGVWTGTRMIVFGGNYGPAYNTGGIYDPVGNTWTASITSTGAPQPLDQEGGVYWTGTHLIQFSGRDNTVTATNRGALYDPNTGVWTDMPTSGANVPTSNELWRGVWTGDRLLLWAKQNGAYSFRP